MSGVSIQFRSVVTQRELRQIVALRAEIAYRMQSLQRLEEGVLMRMVHGADIEPGLHQAWLDQQVRGRVRKQILEVR